MPFLQKTSSLFTTTQKHKFSVFFLRFSFSMFFIFSLFFRQHKKDKNKKCTCFFLKTLLTPWQTAQKSFCTPTHYLCFLRTTKKHLDQVSMQPWTKFWLRKPQILDQVLTLQHLSMNVAYMYFVRMYLDGFAQWVLLLPKNWLPCGPVVFAVWHQFCKVNALIGWQMRLDMLGGSDIGVILYQKAWPPNNPRAPDHIGAYGTSPQASKLHPHETKRIFPNTFS